MNRSDSADSMTAAEFLSGRPTSWLRSHNLQSSAYFDFSALPRRRGYRRQAGREADRVADGGDRQPESTDRPSRKPLACKNQESGNISAKSPMVVLIWQGQVSSEQEVRIQNTGVKKAASKLYPISLKF